MAVNACFIDIDGTLYRSDNGLIAQLLPTIFKYWQNKNNITEEEFYRRNSAYRQQYSSAIKGFIRHTPNFCLEEYQNFLDATIPYEEILQPDPVVVELFRNVREGVPKILVTNSTTRHAQKVLNRLGFAERDFDGLISLNHMGENCKPDPSAFTLMQQYTPQARTEECLFIDDILDNINAAQQHS
jgi:pyrimidine 5'-nucleotidase